MNVSNRRVSPAVGRYLDDARFSLTASTAEDVLRQALIMLVTYAAYDLSRTFVRGREMVAMDHGIYFMNLEKALGIYWEPWIQARVSAVEPVMSIFIWAYSNLHLPLIIGSLVWVFTQHRGSWTRVRNWFLAMNFMALIMFYLLPTAPPRMIFTSGIVDSAYLLGVRSEIFDNGLLGNPYAAMPSLHFGYALFFALILASLLRHPWLRWGGFAYAALVLVAIVATGNHFIVDALAGGLVVLAAYVFAVNVQAGRVSEVAEPSVVPAQEPDG